MNSRTIIAAVLVAYLLLFFFYLFLPLIVMAGSAFNDSRFPSVHPWQGFTTQWFEAMLADRLLWRAVRTSVYIGLGVVAVSVPIGLAAALLLVTLQSRARTFVYAVLVSPVLIPGVILGISTLIFWRQAFGVGGGMLLTIIAQSTFISAYCMLLFLARMQRFDRTLEEAALDLGASHIQTFRRITLPFLMPAIVAGAFIAFLQSFENFNTTIFVIGAESTLTVRLASMVRQTLTPAVNALGLVLIVLTIAGAVVYELLRRREDARRALAEKRRLAQPADPGLAV